MRETENHLRVTAMYGSEDIRIATIPNAQD
jgi:hypothetical protein